MRIERITVCNIASLAGTHSVDFTKDPLKTAGLFSISGVTGSGKSTLLDALCLALFDETPRLHQVGRLADLMNGEKQNDTRMLLRRNTAYGFAEVAFVGVDRRQWTARWSVRRGHNKTDGKLQHVEMVLYCGHIPPGGEGVVAEGGKKTLVKEAIIEKVGLTFEQFTRAVLLAQNDFATFLKADDRQRAEILQALTGTEKFEAISRAVFAQYSEEKKLLDNLEAQLGGVQRMTEETRVEADSAAASATESVRQLEASLKQLESRVEWFRQQAKFLGELQKAKAEFAIAIERRDAASERRAALELTDTVSHEARALRNDKQRAEKDVDTARHAIAAAESTVKTYAEALAIVTANVTSATTDLQQVKQEHAAADSMLKRARGLDALLEPLQSRVEKAQAALVSAAGAMREAATKRADAVNRKQQLIDEQQSLQLQRERLATFVSFVKDSATWQHRLDAAIAASSETFELRRKFELLAGKLQVEQLKIESTRDELTQTQQHTDEATKALQDAEAAEKPFNAEQMAELRTQLDESHRVLSRLQQQLSERQRLDADVDAVEKDIAELEFQRSQDGVALKQLQDVDVPAATRDAQVAREQLEFIVAAVDDHAKRLRLSLQPDHPCPVCGSAAHPYRDQAPDIEVTAVHAAREHLKKLEQQRDGLQSSEQRLVASTQSRSEQIGRQRSQHQKLLSAIREFVFLSVDHPDVAEVLAFPANEREAAALQKMDVVSKARKQIEADEKALRDATKLTQKRRKLADEASSQYQSRRQSVVGLEQKYGIMSTEHTAVETALQKSDERWRDAEASLGELFIAIPNAREDFSTDAAAFRAKFVESTGTCEGLQGQLAGLSAKLLEASARTGPLDDALQKAVELQASCDGECSAVVAERDAYLLQRQGLFEGRAAEIVEQEFATRLQAAGLAVEELQTSKLEASKLQAAAEQTQKSAKTQCADTEAKLVAARTSMLAWLDAFTANSGLALTMDAVDTMLARDAAWFEAERACLRELNERVATAEGACAVHEKQLQQHIDQRPTSDEEDVVFDAVQKTQNELKQAKELQEAALEVVRNDERHRQQNAALAKRLVEQQTIAEPWLKLNELIGSREGDKFRMIAQRRTLDVLLGYANHQLNQLAARYRLERLPESLNLIVIDCDMGDERRSIHSLSGGESFLVSLALALGLASLTSNRLRIESLFIDEGFGSLDSDTLAIAMNALTQLESQGRKVGVISHVTEMTDAIPVQIRVEKRRSGGASRIVIPGADPNQVNPQSELDLNTKTSAVRSSSVKSDDPDEVQAVATAILAILQRESLQGKSRVSTTALRKEIGCYVKDFSAAQVLLAKEIRIDGRSLRLVEM